MPTNDERSAHAQIVEDNLHLLDRNLQLECELAALKARLGRAARIARDLKGSAGSIYAAYGDRPIPRDLAKIASEYRNVAKRLEEALGRRCGSVLRK